MKNFLPLMAAANDRLEKDISTNTTDAFDIENINEDEQYVEMVSQLVLLVLFCLVICFISLFYFEIVQKITFSFFDRISACMKKEVSRQQVTTVNLMKSVYAKCWEKLMKLI